MAYNQPNKMRGVGYFHHFPKTFLKPYGRAEPFPTDAVTLSQLRLEGCEWLHRPHVATSELYSTISENIPILQEDALLVDREKINSFVQNLQPVGLLLQKFHKDSNTPPSDFERRQLLLNLLNPSSDLDAQLNACV